MLIIVADIRAKPDRTDLVKAELEKVVAPTRAEEGCVKYDLHQDDVDPAHFLFYEIWESRDHWQAHMKAPHLAAYRAATEGALDAFVVHEMTRIR